jgi:hypothetical protein
LRLFKESGVHAKSETVLEANAGYQGLAKIHSNCVLAKKRFKRSPLRKANKLRNHDISSRRALSEHVIGFVERFRIVS